MFITKFLTILLLNLNIVKSSDISNDAYEQIQNANKDERRNYKYNRPPEKAIPVAIVYYDGIREEKSINSKGNDANKDISSQKDKGKNESLSLIKLSSDFSVQSATVDTVKVQLPKPKIVTEEEVQIPVAVIYEAESTTARNRKKVLQRSKVRNQGPLNQRRLQKVEQNVSDYKPTTEQFAKQDITSTTIKAKDTINTTEKVNENNAGKKTEAVDSKILQKKRERKPVVPIIQSENRVFGNNGDFHYSYEGGDGTKAFERGELKSFEDDKTGEAVVGGFSYTDKDGQDFSLSYTADENGYRPVGAHLPTPPPIPPAIERALRYLATKTTSEPVTDSIHPKD